MNWALLATRVGLCGVFIVAGLAKLLDIKGSSKAVADFGLPSWTAKPLGIGLPLIEIAVALLLLLVRSAWIGAIGALALLLTFTTAIAINMGLGRRPNCHCFGQINSEPVGWSTLARNGVLASLAAVLVWQARTNPGPSIVSAVLGLTGVEIVAGALGLVFLAVNGSLYWLMLNLFRQNGRLLLRIEALEANRSINQRQLGVPAVLPGLTIGTEAASFDLPEIGRGRATLEGFLREDRPLLLISTDPKCGPCNALMPEIAKWQKDLAPELTIALLSHGSHADNKAKAIEYDITNLMVEKDHDIAGKYQALGTPTAVLVRTDGTIGSSAIGGADRIREFIRYKGWTEAGLAAFTRTPTVPPKAPQPATAKPTLPLGSPAPPFTLPDLGANRVGTTSFNGNGTVLLFWNPGCGFCQRMLPDLQAWEKTKGASSPRLVLVSGGSLAANREMHLDSTVLLDDKFGIGQLYGANGTPSAMLIDADGKIGSGLAIGAPGVLSLLKQDKSSQDPGQRVIAVAN